MINKILKIISDVFYLVPLALYRFRKSYPNEIIHAYGATKAHRTDSEQEISGSGWAFSRRGTLILTDERLLCGDWVIPVDKVKYAEATYFGAAIILKVADNSGNHYQFGLQKDPAWIEQPVIPIKITDEPVKYSIYVKILRYVVYAWLLFAAFNFFLDIIR